MGLVKSVQRLTNILFVDRAYSFRLLLISFGKFKACLADAEELSSLLFDATDDVRNKYRTLPRSTFRPSLLPMGMLHHRKGKELNKIEQQPKKWRAKKI